MKREELYSIFSKLPKFYQREANQYQACCPAHNDKKPSLSIKFTEDSVLLNCFGNCATEEVCQKLGITVEDLYYNNSRNNNYSNYSNGSKKTYFDVEYSYFDENGKYVYSRLRKQTEDGGKKLWFAVNNNGYYDTKKVPKERYLYQFPQLLTSIANGLKTIYITEGEKDVNTITTLGFFATTSGGATSWKKKFAQYFKGLNVVILRDNDEPGLNYAKNIVNSIYNLCASYKIVVTSQADGGDVTDYLNEGHSKEELLQLIDSIPFIPKGEISEELKQQKEIKEEPKDEYLKQLKKLINSRPTHYDFTEQGLGYIFADIHQTRVKYCPDKKSWLYYNGKVWKEDRENKKSQELLKTMLERMIDNAWILESTDKIAELNKIAKALKSNTKKKNILEQASSVNSVLIEAKELDSNINLFNVSNGTFDLTKLEFRQHNPNDLLTKISDVEYNPNANSDLWEKFINDIMQEDKDKISFLKRALGYALTGETIEECLFIFYGATTRNGKSTLLETIKKVMGDYGETSKPDTLELKDKTGGKPSEDVARLQGVRFVSMAESEKSLVLASALVKTLTGGDTINARFLHQNSFEFKPQFKIYFNTNYLPTINDPALFSSGRIKVIPFERHFTEEEQDNYLKLKLATPENQSAVLNWLIAGFKDWKENGLNVPQVIKNATNQYRTEQDVIFQFISEKLEPTQKQEEFVSTEKAYQVYKSFKLANGSNSIIETPEIFKQELQSHNLKIDRKTQSTGKHRVICNYRLKEGLNLDFYPCN